MGSVGCASLGKIFDDWNLKFKYQSSCPENFRLLLSVKLLLDPPNLVVYHSKTLRSDWWVYENTQTRQQKSWTYHDNAK